MDSDPAPATILDQLAQKLHNYQPSEATVKLVRNTPILLLVGVSGAGKDTIKQMLLATGRYHHIISHTTRRPRENHGVMERDGEDYHFISLEAANKMIVDKAFVEAKLYSGNVYGTSAAEIQAAHDTGQIAVTDLEVQGVDEYKRLAPEVQALFILPPSFEEWMRRLQQRGAMTDDEKQQRLQTAINELTTAITHDYYQFIVNEASQQTEKQIEQIMAGVASDPQDVIEAKQLAQDLLMATQSAL